MKNKPANTALQMEQLVPEFSKLPLAMRQRLPTRSEVWRVVELHSGHKNNVGVTHFTKMLQQSTQGKDWVWPKQRLYVVTDPHADADAFVASLLAGGGIVKTGNQLNDFKLSKTGKKSTFIIGGDCLDKGPSNLQLLNSIRCLMNAGAKVKLLAGNHDMRLYMGIHALGLKRSLETEHLFVRMGEKVVPLLQEVHDLYLKGKKFNKIIPDEAECKKRLFPKADWFERFPMAASNFMSDAAIKREHAEKDSAF
jgi:hypothetical protein